MNNKLIFFILYVLLGTTGITIPWAMTGFNSFSISIGLVTLISSSVGYSSAEKIMGLFTQEISSTNKKEAAYNILAMIMSLLCTVFVSIWLSNNHTIWALFLSIVAYIMTCIYWWHQNNDNKNFNDAYFGERDYK